MSRSEGRRPAEQAAADVARLLAQAPGLRRAVEVAVAAAADMIDDDPAREPLFAPSLTERR